IDVHRALASAETEVLVLASVINGVGVSSETGSGRNSGLGSDIADPGLAEGGLARIAWAERAMPVLGLLREECASKQPFAGRSIAACLHITAETAILAGVLTAGGGRVHLAASNPLSTQDDIAAALASQPGVFVNAKTGVDRETYYADLHRALDGAPDLVVDDGGDLVNTLHADRPELLPSVVGGCESTSTGVARLRQMAAAGTLAFPVVAADVSVTRRMFDNGYGTSQSVIDGLLRATNILLAGKTVVVAGYGSSGSAMADRVNRGIRPHADGYVLAGGSRLILLADGRVVNLIAAEGNPAAVMDLSFAAQALALMWLISGEAGLPAGAHPMPAAIDTEVARLTLAAHGTRIDELTAAQREYLASWRQGS